MSTYLKRTCPCCNSQKLHKNKIQSPVMAESLPFIALKKYWCGFFKEKIIFSYARCSECGLLYCPYFFSPSDLDELYSQMPQNMEEVPLSDLIRTQQGYFSYLKKHASLTGEFLEIGPDIGLFTKNCVDEGNFSKFWLFEPNEIVKNSLEKVLKGNKSVISSDMFNFKIIPNNSINLAVAIHVMDHLLDPVSLLKGLKLKLKPGAKLLIVTHDESSLLRRLFKWRWPAFCLQHPLIYNKFTIRKILHKSGYSIITQRKTTNYFKLSFLLKHFLWAIGFKVKKVPDLWNISLGLKLGNIITIAEAN